MLNKIICIYVIVFLFFLAGSVLNANPFISSSHSPKYSNQTETIKYPVIVQIIIYKINPIQRKLQSKLSLSIKQFKNAKSAKTFLFLLLISFIFGVIHAIGPGHGKTVLFSYFLSNKTLFIRGSVIATIVAFMHAISAIIIVGVITFIIKQSYLSSFEIISNKIQLISYLMIIVIGFFLLIKSIFSFLKLKTMNFDNKNNTMKFIAIPLAVGLIPCPGALIILLFSLSFNILSLGLVMVLMMALGMSVTIISASSFALLLEKKVSELSELSIKNNKAYKMIGSFFHIAGALILILFAFFMLIPQLTSI